MPSCRRAYLLLSMYPFLLSALPAADLAETAARFVCAKTRAGGSAAVFPITDPGLEETPVARKLTTRLIAALGECRVTVVDQSKIKDVLREQVRRQSGLYDDDSIPAVGRLAGAQALVYGILDETSLQLRVVDAQSGTVLGAAVQSTGRPAGRSDSAAANEAGGDDDARLVPVDDETAKESLQHSQLNDWLQELERQDPELFLYATSSGEEFKEFVERDAAAAGRILDRVEALPPAALSKLNRMKKNVNRLRTRYPRIGERWSKLRGTARRRVRREDDRLRPVQRLRPFDADSVPKPGTDTARKPGQDRPKAGAERRKPGAAREERQRKR